MRRLLARTAGGVLATKVGPFEYSAQLLVTDLRAVPQYCATGGHDQAIDMRAKRTGAVIRIRCGQVDRQCVGHYAIARRDKCPGYGKDPGERHEADPA